MTEFTEFLARHYVRLLRRHPIPTVIVTLLAVGAIAFAVYTDDAKRKLEEQKRREALATYPQQLEQLDKVQQSLKNFSDFVFQQRNRLQDSEQVIAKLQEEKQRMEPLVQADRSVVEAVFQMQEQRSATTTRRERWIGFGLGVGASLIASFIYAAIAYSWRRTRQTAEPGNT